jgi:oxygen-independent coproporphyrinogen-3 oxidase
VRAILGDYIDRPDESFDAAHYGIALSPAEQRRRYLIQSVLQVDGLEFEAYRRRFAADALDDWPELLDLKHLGLATTAGGRLLLTAAGLERSDTIGPWLYSAGVRTLMEAYELR